MLSPGDPSRIPDDQWEYEKTSADGLRVSYIHWIDRESGSYFRKTENLAEPALIEANRQSFNDSYGKRFGDGKVVARIPLNVLYRDFPKRLQDGDTDFVKHWLNSEQARPYRTFRGRV